MALLNAARAPLVPGRNASAARSLDTAILFPQLDNFAASCHGVALQTACRMNLFNQAKSLGILTEFIDGQGHRRVTSEAALRIIVDAFPARTPYRFVAGPVVIRAGQPARTELLETATLPLRWTIQAG